MQITATTTADQIPHEHIYRAYEVLEALNPDTFLYSSWRVRKGALVRQEFYVKRTVHQQHSGPNSAFFPSTVYKDLVELDNNLALGFGFRSTFFRDTDQAENVLEVKLLLTVLETDFGSPRSPKLKALAEAIA